jgi:Helix-turn-helix domain
MRATVKPWFPVGSAGAVRARRQAEECRDVGGTRERFTTKRRLRDTPMAGRTPTEPKLAALRERRTLNPRSERVTDALFQQSAFFDARDLPQVKYEMIRRVEVDHVAVADAAAAFGLSRQCFYEARAVVARDGFAGLLPRKRGPRGAHKLRPDVMAFLAKRRAADPSLSLVALVPLVKNRFGVVVHPRSIGHAWRRQRKKRP